MPVPQEPDWQPSKAADERPPYDGQTRTRSEESIRIEDCDGPIPDVPMNDSSSVEDKHGNDTGPSENLCTDRAELIERIKRGESPTWVPNQAVSGNLNCQKQFH